MLSSVKIDLVGIKLDNELSFDFHISETLYAEKLVISQMLLNVLAHIIGKISMVWKLNKSYSNMFLYLVSLSVCSPSCFKASYEIEFE